MGTTYQARPYLAKGSQPSTVFVVRFLATPW
jgi:hypothetical protein